MIRWMMPAAMPLASSTTTRPTTAMITALLRPAPALALGALGHQQEPGPDDAEEAQPRPQVGHAGERRVEGGGHRVHLVVRGGGQGNQGRRRGHEEGGQFPGHSQLHQLEPPTGVCSALGGGGLGGGTWRAW